MLPPMTDAPAQRTATAEFWLGVRHELPLQLGVIPFGLVFGIDAELKKRGIKRVQTDAYHVGPYKYSNLNDALAEAGRSSAKHKSTSV